MWRAEDSFAGVGSPPNLSVSGIELRSSGLAADVLPTEPSHEPSYFILLFFSIGLFIYFTYMGVCLCVCAWCLRRFEEGSMSPGAEVTKWVLGQNLGPL